MYQWRFWRLEVDTEIGRRRRSGRSFTVRSVARRVSTWSNLILTSPCDLKRFPIIGSLRVILERLIICKCWHFTSSLLPPDFARCFGKSTRRPKISGCIAFSPPSPLERKLKFHNSGNFHKNNSRDSYTNDNRSFGFLDLLTMVYSTFIQILENKK